MMLVERKACCRVANAVLSPKCAKCMFLANSCGSQWVYSGKKWWAGALRQCYSSSFIPLLNC